MPHVCITPELPEIKCPPPSVYYHGNSVWFAAQPHTGCLSLHFPVLTTCVLASSKAPTGGSFTAAFHNLPLRSERTSLSGHHITFRLRPSSRSFVMFMITTGRTAPPRPRQLQLHLLSPPPFPLTASISVFYGAQRLHLFEGPTKNAVHKTENCRIWWHGPGQSGYTSSVLNAGLRSAGSFVLRLHAVPEMYLSKFIVAIWYLMCFYDAWRTTHRRTDAQTRPHSTHSTRSKLKGT